MALRLAVVPKQRSPERNSATMTRTSTGMLSDSEGSRAVSDMAIDRRFPDVDKALAVEIPELLVIEFQNDIA